MLATEDREDLSLGDIPVVARARTPGINPTALDRNSVQEARNLRPGAVPVESLDSDPDAHEGRGITDAVTAEPTCEPDEPWESIATGVAPEPRMVHTAVWTGTYVIVWGGFKGRIQKCGT